jgi:hypothetical protein
MTDDASERRALIYLLCALALALFIGGISWAAAHEAPSGWTYPQDCCAGQHCRPVECGTIIDQPDGSVNWLGLHFSRDKVRISGDASCHVCISYGEIGGNRTQPTRQGHCIFLSPTN